MKSNRLNTPGLFELLRSARLNSGLSQAQVGAALGMERRYAKSFISRLERGALANPSLRVVIDFLRACKADPTEVAEAFKRWLSIPLSVPEHRAGPRTKARPRPEDKANLELRRQAAWYTLAQVLEYFLHHEFGALGLSPDEPWRKVSARLARRTFRILYETRTGDEKQRARRLGRIRAWARSKALPEELIEHIGTRVTGLFCDMVKDGDLEWLPSLEDARSTMALAPRARILTDEQMCRQARLEQKAKEHAAFRQKYETLLEKAKALLGQAGLNRQQMGNYLAFVTAFSNVARSTKPRSEERSRAVKLQLKVGLRKWHDPALVERLGQLIMAEWDAAEQPDEAAN